MTQRFGKVTGNVGEAWIVGRMILGTFERVNLKSIPAPLRSPLWKRGTGGIRLCSKVEWEAACGKSPLSPLRKRGGGRVSAAVLLE
ncbi:hypothetical protein GMST_22980 [Geomonas silvestris]|uniref:Uncharacterized protein n=1 Tax=Geomonas silvestris TaxID=2740184 RepID=A0A6V8MJK3_9BACT|nr:hypothetical protein GMST_22980 [Geomonas silvestris]